MNAPVTSAGELRHVVDLKRPASGVGTRGQRSGADTTLQAGVRAKVETLSGRELEIANAVYAGASVQVIIRHYPGLKRRDYVLFGSRVLEIGHIDNVEQLDQWNVLLCSEDA